MFRRSRAKKALERGDHAALAELTGSGWLSSHDYIAGGPTLLVDAIARHDTKAAELLLANGHPLESCGGGLGLHTYSARHALVSKYSKHHADGAVRILDLLIKHGLNPKEFYDTYKVVPSFNERTYKTTLLHAVVGIYDGAPLTKRLLQHGADANAVDGQGETPLFRSVSDEQVACLLLAGADPHFRNREGRTAQEVQDLCETTFGMVRERGNIFDTAKRLGL